MNKNCFIWTRVSTKYQEDNGGSLDNQKATCKDYAEQNGFNIIGEFGGKHESAKTPGKLIKEMLSAVKRDQSITHILVSEVDRFSRNASQALSIIDDLKKQNVSIIAIKSGIDSSTKEGRMMLGILLCTAEWDNANRVDKFLSGRRHCMETGVWCSKAPMGYDKSGKSINSTYIVNETGELIRKAFLWKLHGVSSKEILIRLKARGLSITHQRLHQLLTNPFYAGKIKNHLIGNQLVDGKHPALITYDQYLEVQRVLSGKTGRYVHQKVTPQFPLKHHVLCSKDGTPLTAYFNKKKHLGYYKCTKAGCSQNTSAKLLHAKYKAVLGEYGTPVQVNDVFRKIVKHQLSEMNSELEKDLSVLKRSLTSVENDIKTTQLRFATGKIDEDTFNVAMSEQSNTRASLLAEIEKGSQKISNLDNRVEDVIVTCSNLGTLWDCSDLETRQQIQKLVFPDGIIWNKEKGCYLTIRENSVFSVFRKLSEIYGTKKEATSTEIVSLCG